MEISPASDNSGEISCDGMLLSVQKLVIRNMLLSCGLGFSLEHQKRFSWLSYLVNVGSSNVTKCTNDFDSWGSIHYPLEMSAITCPGHFRNAMAAVTVFISYISSIFCKKQACPSIARIVLLQRISTNYFHVWFSPMFFTIEYLRKTFIYGVLLLTFTITFSRHGWRAAHYWI